MRLRAQLYRWHRWIGLIAGLQLLIWTATGLFMAIVPIDVVRGKHLAADTPTAKVVMDAQLLPLGTITNRHHVGVILKAELRDHLGKPVYEVDYGDGHEHLFDARSGEQISPLPNADIRALAQKAMRDDVAIGTMVQLNEDAPIEYRGDMPVWQITMADAAGTRLYVQPDTGKLLARRTSTWRLYDFLWGLHIMDYAGRDNFNNMLLRFVAGFSLLMTASGAGLLIARYWPRRKSAITNL
jgi:uncharacterized iron-regulated membrane protein